MGNSIQDFDVLHDIGPGRHFYQFYKNKEDLLKVLLLYWQSGIQKGDFCFWVVPGFMTVDEATEFLEQNIPEFEEHAAMGGFELREHAEWYGTSECFDGDLVMGKYVNKMKEAIGNGFHVIRVSGDMGSYEAAKWPLLREYERKGHARIHELPCIALCSYPIHDLNLQETKDVLDNHHGVLVAKV